MNQLSPAQYSAIEKAIQRVDAPFYFYDLDVLKNHLSELSSHLDDGITLWYACKANPMSAILKIFRNLGFGLDVASSGELEQALNTGISGEKLIATGPGKSKEYLRKLILAHVGTIVLESPNQLKWLDEVSKELEKTTEALLRLQLDWDEGKSVLGGGDITPFGMGLEDWKEVDLSRYENVKIKGLHVFQWGNILEVSKLSKIWERSFSELSQFAKAMKIDLKVLDLGGGLGVPYDQESPRLDFSKVASVLKELKTKYQVPQVWMELGRYSVADMGHYLTPILDKKKTRGITQLISEGGINHQARVALTGQSFPCQVFGKSGSSHEFTIHGPLCTALDKLGTYHLPESTEIGDWLIFSMAGAYGFTESMPFFLCHDLPAEVISYQGDLMYPRPSHQANVWMV